MKSLKLIGVVCQLARHLLMNVTWIEASYLQYAGFNRRFLWRLVSTMGLKKITDHLLSHNSDLSCNFL